MQGIYTTKSFEIANKYGQLRGYESFIVTPRNTLNYIDFCGS